MITDILKQVDDILNTKAEVENYINKNFNTVSFKDLVRLSRILTPQKRYKLIETKVKKFLNKDEVIVVKDIPYIRQFYPNKRISHITVVVIKKDNCDIYRLNGEQLHREAGLLSDKSINRISVRHGEAISIQPSNARDWNKYKLPSNF